MYRAAKRDKNEQQLIDAARAMGASVRQLDDPGMPDLLLGYQGLTYLVEVKSKSGKLTVAQLQFFNTWKGQACVARTVDDIYQLLTRVTPQEVYQVPAFTAATLLLSRAFKIR